MSLAGQEPVTLVALRREFRGLRTARLPPIPFRKQDIHGLAPIRWNRTWHIEAYLLPPILKIVGFSKGPRLRGVWLSIATAQPPCQQPPLRIRSRLYSSRMRREISYVIASVHSSPICRRVVLGGCLAASGREC